MGKTSSNHIVLKNDGTVPATVKFEQISSDFFRLESSSTATIQPKNYQSFEIKFDPKTDKVEKAIVQYKTLHNPYEAPKIILMGEGFFEPTSFENLVIDNELK